MSFALRNSVIAILSVCMLSALVGCATVITDDGKRVLMVTGITATEAQNYEEIGPVTCVELASSLEESCKNQLRNAAAQQGADIIVIESRDTSNSQLQINARAYKRKTKAL